MGGKMRKLASIRVISELKPIEGADFLQLAIVDGWQCVVRKGEFKVGQKVVYFEIDSWVPYLFAPFLMKDGKIRTFNGVEGDRIRTIKLRGQLSQGLVIPIPLDVEKAGLLAEGDDVTELLGVQKYERELPASLQGMAKGSFPSFIRKTDQERIQNMKRNFEKWKEENVWFEVTTKLDGSSMTVYCKDGQTGVCSRNLELKVEENPDNTFVKTMIDRNIHTALKKYCESSNSNLALQGELMGPGIQGNREGFTSFKFFLYDIYDIDQQKYVDPVERMLIYVDLVDNFGMDIEHVPVVNLMTLEQFDSIEEVLSFAEGESINNKVREGIVFKSEDGQISFKAISNTFLLKGGD